MGFIMNSHTSNIALLATKENDIVNGELKYSEFEMFKPGPNVIDHAHVSNFLNTHKSGPKRLPLELHVSYSLYTALVSTSDIGTSTQCQKGAESSTTKLDFVNHVGSRSIAKPGNHNRRLLPHSIRPFHSGSTFIFAVSRKTLLAVNCCLVASDCCTLSYLWLEFKRDRLTCG